MSVGRFVGWQGSGSDSDELTVKQIFLHTFKVGVSVGFEVGLRVDGPKVGSEVDGLSVGWPVGSSLICGKVGLGLGVMGRISFKSCPVTKHEFTSSRLASDSLSSCVVREKLVSFLS